MKIAIVGYSGYIGTHLLQHFGRDPAVPSILRVARDAGSDAVLDLARAEDFCYDVLDDVDVVILTAAVSSPDRCAADFESCWQINVVGTQCFICHALERHCLVLFFSSDAVFGIFPAPSMTRSHQLWRRRPTGG